MIRNTILQIARTVSRDIARHSSWYSLVAMAAATFAVEVVRERERVRVMLRDLERDLTANLDTIAERMTDARQSEHDATSSITDADVRSITEGKFRDG